MQTALEQQEVSKSGSNKVMGVKISHAEDQ